MYANFSQMYDALMGDVDYEARTEYLCGLFERFDRRPTLLLDLACGTGGFSNAFAQKGVSVIGVDISPEMLDQARKNSLERGNDILFLCQDAAELDLYGTVDGAVCCMDSLNHITDHAMLCRAIERVSLFLEKGRLFIFDVNTLYKHSEVLGDNVFVIDEEDVYCVWSNEYDEQTHVTDITLDFFVPDENGLYERTSEYISERAYTHKELEAAVKAAGLELLAVYGDQTHNAPKARSQRNIYITRKA